MGGKMQCLGDLFDQAIIGCEKENPDIGHRNHRHNGRGKIGQSQKSPSGHALIDKQSHGQSNGNGKGD